jgi:hypothetical protein
MATSRHRSAHKTKAAHFTRTLQAQRAATRRKQTTELLAQLRKATGVDLLAAEKGYGTAPVADVTAFDTLKG